MKTAFWPMGIGDHIIMSGAAVQLARRYGALRVPSWKSSLQSVRSLYIDYPEIEVVQMRPIELEAVAQSDRVGSASWTQHSHGELLYKGMYELLGVPLSERWDSCTVRAASKHFRQIKTEYPGQPVYHEHPEYGQRLRAEFTKGYRIPSPIFGSILHYVEMLEAASEIHVIESSVVHLIESLEPKGRLFLHRYKRSENFPLSAYVTDRLGWQLVT